MLDDVYLQNNTLTTIIKINQNENRQQRKLTCKLFSGHPALRARHVRFPITKPAAQRWLEHMRAAVDEVGIKGDTKEKFLEFVTEVAFFLQNIDEEGNRIYG
jgi:truncated hemoglobin YjbI